MPEFSGTALFDFDDTLIAGDSLPRFLDTVVGVARTRMAMVGALTGALAAHAIGRPPGTDFPGSVKALLLGLTLPGVSLAQAHDAARALKPRLRWLAPQVAALHAHAEAGRRVVVVSGALDIYLPILLEGLPVHTVLATDMECRNGVLTGALTGANCVRQAKADRVRAFLAEQSTTGPTWGYGNRPHDLPMLALVTHATII